MSTQTRQQALQSALHAQWELAHERGELRNGRLLGRGGFHKEKREKRGDWKRELPKGDS